MINRLLGSVTPWLLAALIGLLVFQYQLLQSADAERDTAVLQAEHAQERAAILREHQQWQRQQIKTLNTALAERDQTLTTIANDIRASNAALEQLGEQNAEIRTWLDPERKLSSQRGLLLLLAEYEALRRKANADRVAVVEIIGNGDRGTPSDERTN